MRSVNLSGSRPGRTWAHVSGIDTGANFRPRGENGATAVPEEHPPSQVVEVPEGGQVDPSSDPDRH